MNKLSYDDIRMRWIEFWKSKNHKIQESSSLINNVDKSLLWVNAGIVPLKKYFDGSEVPNYKRICNIQKCIRTNDIENIGYTSRHLTFFEMLGNFSIGDYFRKDALEYAFEFLTDKKWLGIDINKLYFTVYPNDVDSIKQWSSLGVNNNKIIKLNDNFWEIGTGPCGPCTEIFYDRGTDFDSRGIELLEKDIENDRFIEIWNIVFSQFNSEENLERKDYRPLPSKNIDTGAGLERLCCLSQNVNSNFETDLFFLIINEIEKFTQVKYNGQKDFKIISDHIRTVTFAITDGAVISNEGRGYILRRLVRRALIYKKNLNIEGIFLYKLVDCVVSIYNKYYPELIKMKDKVISLLKEEEIKFNKTLDRGEEKLKSILLKSKNLSGEDGFLLYDTFGFPLDMLVEYSKQLNFKFDINGYYEQLNMQKLRSKNIDKNSNSMNIQNAEYINFKDINTFIYDENNIKTNVLATFKDGIVLKETCIYAESGGQVSDLGFINDVKVIESKKLPNGQILHVGNFNIKKNDSVIVRYDEEKRKKISVNHTSVHILFSNLRKLFGDYIGQQGSYLDKDYFRFDFNNFDILTEEQILKLENSVKKDIKKNVKVTSELMALDDAIKIGAIAEFGEKYSELVKVVKVGNITTDLCGGTHISNTSEINDFMICSFSSIGSGIYRIEGITSDFNNNFKKYINNILNDIKIIKDKINKNSNILKLDNIKNIKEPLFKNEYKYYLELKKYINNLKTYSKELDKNVKNIEKESAVLDLSKYEKLIENNILIINENNLDNKYVKSMLDVLLDKYNLDFALIINKLSNKIIFTAKSNKPSYNCSQIIKDLSVCCGGNGGGSEKMAQGNGSNFSKLEEGILHLKETFK